MDNRWSLIAGRIPGRTDNEIKNFWNTHLSKKLISQGIDPRTHKPLNSNNINPLPNQYKLQIPSPKPYPNLNPNPYPSLNANPNPNPISSPDLEAMDGSGSGIILHDNRNDYFGGTNLNFEEGWQNPEAGIVGIGLNGTSYHRDAEEEGGIDCNNDNVFSSFLDSLINDDMFLQHEHQQLQNLHQNITSSEDKINHNQVDPIVLSSAGFGNGSIWEASLSSRVTADEEINGQFIDQAGNQF